MQLKKNSFLMFLPSLWHRALWFVGFRPSTYLSISSLPISVWWDIHETGNAALLIPDNKSRVTEKLFIYCSELWDGIRQQHLDAFGEPDKYIQFLDARTELAIAQLDHAITDNNWYLTIIDIAQQKIDAHIGESGKQISNIKRKQIIEGILKMHYPINPKTTTVEEYFNYEELAHETVDNGKSV